MQNRALQWRRSVFAIALSGRAVRSEERLLSGRSGPGPPSHERLQMASERLFNKRASQHLPCLVSPPENKYVRILTSVLFQICQYSLIGQVVLPQALQAPNRLFWFHCRRLHPVVSGQRLFALE